MLVLCWRLFADPHRVDSFFFFFLFFGFSFFLILLLCVCACVYGHHNECMLRYVQRRRRFVCELMGSRATRQGGRRTVVCFRNQSPRCALMRCVSCHVVLWWTFKSLQCIVCIAQSKPTFVLIDDRSSSIGTRIHHHHTLVLVGSWVGGLLVV